MDMFEDQWIELHSLLIIGGINIKDNVEVNLLKLVNLRQVKKNKVNKILIIIIRKKRKKYHRTTEIIKVGESAKQ
jgi:hypothetical protein